MSAGSGDLFYFVLSLSLTVVIICFWSFSSFFCFFFTVGGFDIKLNDGKDEGKKNFIGSRSLLFTVYRLSSRLRLTTSIAIIHLMPPDCSLLILNHDDSYFFPCWFFFSCASTCLCTCSLSKNSFIWAIFPCELKRTRSTKLLCRFSPRWEGENPVWVSPVRKHSEEDFLFFPPLTTQSITYVRTYLISTQP